MRKITKEAAQAFIEGRNFHKSNTRVIKFLGNSVEFRLFDNMIALYSRKLNTLFVTTAGYPTVTTKERLNGILDAFGLPRVYQRDFEWYFTDGVRFNEPREFNLKKRNKNSNNNHKA